MKALHKLVMTSAAYKRVSAANAAALAKDPANDLLSHFNRRRLEAEEIRDASLQVSGELNLKTGMAIRQSSSDPGRDVRHDRQPRQQLECFA